VGRNPLAQTSRRLRETETPAPNTNFPESDPKDPASGPESPVTSRSIRTGRSIAMVPKALGLSEPLRKASHTLGLRHDLTKGVVPRAFRQKCRIVDVILASFCCMHFRYAGGPRKSGIHRRCTSIELMPTRNPPLLCPLRFHCRTAVNTTVC
jgi:hypothetical protein